jgi:hypothetical protein
VAKVRPADAKLPPGWYAKYALEEAKRGDPSQLIGRLLSRRQLTDYEIQFIVEVLEKMGGKRQADRLRKIEQMLIAEQVEELIEDGMKKEAAIKKIGEYRGRSRRHVFKAISWWKSRNSRLDF